jgi:ATP synthase subunit 6
MLSPLEQFEIINLVSIFYQSWAISNSNIYFFFQILLLFFISNLYLTNKILPNRYQYILEQLYLFIKNLIENNINKKALKFFPFIFTLFFVIILSNFFGMVPYSFTITSHLIFTLFLSFLTFFGINFLGLQLHGLHFFSLFLPAGAPFILAPFLIFIELLSYVARVFSLAIRLFANLMSGHTLLKILSEFGWTMLLAGGLGFLTFLFPFVIVFLITGLELAIAGLQAYVFTILTCIYFNDALNLH